MLLRVVGAMGLALLLWAQGAAAQWEPEKKDRSRGVLGPLRLGPLVGIGVPNLVNFGATLKVTRYFGAGVNVGLIPTVRMPNYGDAKVSYQEYDAYARLYPLGGGLFVGAGLGYARAQGSYEASTDISSYVSQYPELGLPNALRTRSEGSVQTMVVPIQVGYFQIFRSGLCLGADVGVQLPVATSRIDIRTRAEEEELPPELADRFVTPAEDEVRDTIDSVASSPVPTFNFRIGWML